MTYRSNVSQVSVKKLKASTKKSSKNRLSKINSAAQNYQDSGVDIKTGDDFVDWIQKNQGRQPHQNRLVSGIGGFASLFRIQFPEMKSPCLVTCTDGVGTKVKLASYFNRYEEVAQDCVAMCVNDLICTGGKPLMFLDYYATGKINLKAAQAFIKGLKKACHEANCALVGGETAEMPGVYQNNDFDCAGFAVGIVDEAKSLGLHKVVSGDQVIGVSSNGFHSNGFSLLRKVFAKDLDQWQQTLLKPTHLYVKLMAELQKNKINLHAAAHITGGGIENVPRVIPQHLNWKKKYWEFPEEFKEVQNRLKISDAEMRTTFNCGVGFVLIQPKNELKKTFNIIHKLGFKAYKLGSIEKKKKAL